MRREEVDAGAVQMTTMEISASSNGTSIPGEALPDTLLLSTLPLNPKTVAAGEEQPHLNGNSCGGNTVCYLANGTGQIDRLDLVLPLTSLSSTMPCAPLDMSPSSPPFSSSHLIESSMTHTEYSADCDRTPVNSEKGSPFSPTESSPLTQSASFSSCRTVDSGTESICSDSIEDYMMHDLAADRILKFFAADKSKSMRYPGRRPSSGGLRQTSTDEDEDIYSDESTLSESSVSTPDYTPNQIMITPESVVAAIDKQIKQQRTTTDELVIDDKDKSGEDASDKTNNAAATAEPSSNTLQSSPPIEADNAIPNSEPKPSDTARTVESVHKNKSEIDDEFDYDDDYGDDDCPRIPLIRSTSLKTGKTPPGTPRGKKIVRFADALGLDLESVRHIVDDVPYQPPLAAFKGLKLDEDDKRWLFGQQSPALLQPSSTQLLSSSPLVNKPNLRVLFCQPSSDPGPFLERVRTHKLCLENCLVTGPSGPSDMFTITCIIRVLNIGFEKSVNLRYTTNEWLTWTDVMASYVPNSCDGFSDKFTVTFHLAVNSNGHQAMMPGQRLLFALKYMASGNQEFWDNNMGLNYALIYQRS